MRLLSLAAALLLWGMVLLAVVRTGRPPAPKVNNGLSNEFSAGRAFVLLQSLLPSGDPHPTGSPANAAIRDRIVAQFRHAGLDVEVQRAAAGSNEQVVENIIARLPGETDGPAAMLVAHYDSVANGPGAADDLSGVAIVLEAARILKGGLPHRSPIVFLVTDGEEQGLWGAKAFVREHALARDVGVVVNLEARGTSGRSLMFQTSDDNAWLVAAYAKSVANPDTASVYSEVYRRLPNDTDLTVFLDAGIPGINLAFIGNAECYHTPQDDLSHLDLASLQHQGDNAIGLLRTFAAMDRSQPRQGRAVYTDLLGLMLIRWPQRWTPAITLVATLALCLAVWGLMKWKVLSLRDCLMGAVAAPCLLIAPAFVALGLGRLLAGHAPMQVLPWVAAILTMTGGAWQIGRWVSGWGLWCGIWFWWAAATLVTAFFLPAASYLLLIPFVFAPAAALGVFPALGRRWPWIAWGLIAVPAVLAAIFWDKTAMGLADAVGSGSIAAIAVLVAMSFVAFTPLWLRRDSQTPNPEP